MTRPSGPRWVCLDVGETLVEETRIWSAWADELGIPRMTFLAAFGAVVERGLEYSDVFGIFGVGDWRSHVPAVRRALGPLSAEDLYPDALATLAALPARGYRVAVVGNQPAHRHGELRALGIEADVIAMSEELGASKPDARFFELTLDRMGLPDPLDVAYVGDRIDNDVLPSAAAGLRAVWLRRGPWGVIPRSAPPQATLVVGSLAELVDRVDEAFPETVGAVVRA